MQKDVDPVAATSVCQSVSVSVCVCVWLLLARTPQNQQGLLSLELLGHKSQVNVA